MVDIVASPQGDVLKGIIYKLKNVFKINDPISSNYVVPSSIGTRSGDIKSLVIWDDITYGATNVQNSWVQLSFPNRFIFPTAYSLKEPTNGRYSAWVFAREWKVYGIHEGEENEEGKWDLLGINDSSQTIFCRDVLASGHCVGGTDVGTFMLKPMPSNIGYRHMR